MELLFGASLGQYLSGAAVGAWGAFKFAAPTPDEAQFPNDT